MKIIIKIIFSLLCLFVLEKKVQGAVIYQGNNGVKSYSDYELYTEIKKAKFNGTIRNMYCSQFYRQAPPNGNTCSKINWGHGIYSMNKSDRDGIAIAAIFDNVSSYGNREIIMNAYLALADGPNYEYKCKSGYCVSKEKGTVKSDLGTDGNSKNYYISIDHKDYSTLGLKNHIIDRINNYIKPKFINYNKFYNIKLSSSGLKYNATTKKYEMRVDFKNSNSNLISWHGNSSTYKGDDKWINNSYSISIDTHSNLTSCTISDKTTTGFKLTCTPVNLMLKSDLKVSVKLSYTERYADRYDCDGSDESTYQLMVDELLREINFDRTLSYSSSNQLSCNEMLVGKTPAEKEKIYQEYLKQGLNYNKILDFNDSKCEYVNCASTTKKNTSCGSTSITNDISFSPQDISCYKETISISGNTAYCVTDFSLNTSALTNLKSSKIDSGRIVLSNATQSNFGGNLTKTCYIISNNVISPPTLFSGFNYKNYISEITVANNNLLNSVTISLPNDISSTVNGVKKYVRSYHLTLNQKNYVMRMTGVKTLDTSCLTKGSCIDTYGLIINFTSSGMEDFNPKLVLGNTYISNYGLPVNINSNDNNCKVQVENEKRIIIPTPYNSKGKMNLEYRMIDTIVPFPGKSGNGRKTGSNWCYYDKDTKDCANTNKVVKKYILDANDSYNRRKKDVLYKINLTPILMNQIRTYNSNNIYTDYNVTCDNMGKNCVNNFLKTFGIIKQ